MEKPTPKDLTRLQQVVLGAAVSLVGIGIALACGSGAQSIPRLAQCQLDALRVLPSDPNMATVYDVADIIERVRLCHRAYPSDAGP